MAEATEPQVSSRVIRERRASAGLKFCFTCQTEKSVSDFTKCKSRWDGLEPKCRACVAEYRARADSKERSQLYYLANAEKIKATSDATRAADPGRRKRHYAANREKQKADAAAWRAENPERMKATAAAYYARSAAKRAEYYAANKERLLAKGAKWKAENPAKRSANHAKLRAAKAVPPWVDHAKIEEFYAEAIRLTRETGIRHEVDHIYPLDHPTCCGLHVPWNLQVLTRSQNRKKASRLPEV